MLTELGKFIRKLRIDKGVLLGQMARSIEVSSAYLSAIENGKKNPTESLLGNIVSYFSLTTSQAADLRAAALNSPASVKFDLKNSENEERILVSAFARQVADLSQEQKSNIFDILNTNGKKVNENE